MTAVGLIGLGEVGRVLAEDLAARGVRLTRPWDTAFAEDTSRAARNALAVRLVPGTGPADAVGAADVVFCAVTAASTLDAARAAAPHLPPGAWFVDLNSASPARKQQAAAVVEAAGARYVEAAVMSPIQPRRLATPVLLGGPHARRFAAVGAGLGWRGLEVFADRVGPAAATKLCRSIVVKGLEALVTESLLTARCWDVEDDVLSSLSNLIPAPDWPDLARYLVARSVEHGTRRAQEMREAADTVAAAGVEPLMSTATAERQAWAGTSPDALAGLLDRMATQS
jgi:3-hydroxyisobutyrate dehydrogenase-like beta-hydroxyacid dehydrogenase